MLTLHRLIIYVRSLRRQGRSSGLPGPTFDGMIIRSEEEKEDVLGRTGKLETRKVLIALIIVSLALSALSLGGLFFRHAYGLERNLKGLIPKFDADAENNVPTWFQSALLLACSLVLGLIARSKKLDGDPFAKHWTGLSLIFLALSIEEVAGFHEIAMVVLQGIFHPTGYLSFGWVVPGLIFCIVVFVGYWRFLGSVEKPYRSLFLISGMIYVAGGLGVEFLAGNRVSHYGWVGFADDLTYALISNAGETMEMVGLSIFLYALLRYARDHSRELQGFFE